MKTGERHGEIRDMEKLELEKEQKEEREDLKKRMRS